MNENLLKNMRTFCVISFSNPFSPNQKWKAGGGGRGGGA